MVYGLHLNRNLIESAFFNPKRLTITRVKHARRPPIGREQLRPLYARVLRSEKIRRPNFTYTLYIVPQNSQLLGRY